MAAGCYRCSICGLSFPREPEFGVCPQCGETTSHMNTHPMRKDEAASILAHARFERYYEEEHEADLRPRPEEDALVAG